jgi:curved DNA-binding protein CbpA
MNLLPENPYKTLGVERNASEAEIKQAYFALIREHPPERDPEGFKRIRSAYEKLRASRDRAGTDLLFIDDQAAPVEPLPYLGPTPEISSALITSDLVTLEALRMMEEALATS